MLALYEYWIGACKAPNSTERGLALNGHNTNARPRQHHYNAKRRPNQSPEVALRRETSGDLCSRFCAAPGRSPQATSDRTPKSWPSGASPKTSSRVATRDEGGPGACPSNPGADEEVDVLGARTFGPSSPKSTRRVPTRGRQIRCHRPAVVSPPSRCGPLFATCDVADLQHPATLPHIGSGLAKLPSRRPSDT